MRSKITGGNNVIVKVSPTEVKRLRDDEVIIVSRAQLNARLAFISMEKNNEMNEKNILVLRNAINDMLEIEKKERTMAIGAKMKVCDVKKIFSKLERMPGNSFAQIKV